MGSFDFSPVSLASWANLSWDASNSCAAKVSWLCSRYHPSLTNSARVRVPHKRTAEIKMHCRETTAVWVFERIPRLKVATDGLSEVEAHHEQDPVLLATPRLLGEDVCSVAACSARPLENSSSRSVCGTRQQNHGDTWFARDI